MNILCDDVHRHVVSVPASCLTHRPSVQKCWSRMEDATALGDSSAGGQRFWTVEQVAALRRGVAKYALITHSPQQMCSPCFAC